MFENQQKAIDAGGTLHGSYTFGAEKAVLVLWLPDGVDPKTVVDMEWELIPNEKTEAVGSEPNTTNTVG